MEVDNLLADAEKLTGGKVTVEGVCTHICRHGGRKIFLMGTDDTQVIRIPSVLPDITFTGGAKRDAYAINGGNNEK